MSNKNSCLLIQAFSFHLYPGLLCQLFASVFTKMGVKANLPEKMVQDVRGGTRGGRDQFSWSTVKADKHRASYLGNSVKVPHGRWAEEKDVFWYAKERTIGFTKGELEEEEKRKRREEIEEIKRKERELMDEATGSGSTAKKNEKLDVRQSPPRNHPTRHAYHRDSERRRSKSPFNRSLLHHQSDNRDRRYTKRDDDESRHRHGDSHRPY